MAGGSSNPLSTSCRLLPSQSTLELSGSTWACNKITISTIIFKMTTMMEIMIMKCNKRYRRNTNWYRLITGRTLKDSDDVILNTWGNISRILCVYRVAMMTMMTTIMTMTMTMMVTMMILKRMLSRILGARTVRWDQDTNGYRHLPQRHAICYAPSSHTSSSSSSSSLLSPKCENSYVALYAWQYVGPLSRAKFVIEFDLNMAKNGLKGERNAKWKSGLPD